MKIQLLSLLAAAALACAACKNNAEAPAAITDASTSAPTSGQAPTAEASAAGSATTAEATTAAAPAADATTTAAPPASGSWRYEGSDGAKRTASVSGRGGDGAQLVFADDPVWGRTAYVEFAQDGIDCPTGCKAQISVDGGAAKTVQASRPETPQPRLSLREPDKLWQSIANAKTLSIEFPAKSGTGKVEFDVAGVDTSKLPAGWN